MRTYRFLLYFTHAQLSLLSLVAAVAGLPFLCAGFVFVAVGEWAQRKADGFSGDLEIMRPAKRTALPISYAPAKPESKMAWEGADRVRGPRHRIEEIPKTMGDA